MEKPTLWSEGEGRGRCAGITEGARIDSRGSKDGRLGKTYSSVLETRFRGWGGHRPLGIRQRKRRGPERESEGVIGPLAGQEHITLSEGRNPALWVQPQSGGSGECHVANHPGYDPDATEEALRQGQARTSLSLVRALGQDQPGRGTRPRLAAWPCQPRQSRRGRAELRSHSGREWDRNGSAAPGPRPERQNLPSPTGAPRQEPQSGGKSAASGDSD